MREYNKVASLNKSGAKRCYTGSPASAMKIKVLVWKPHVAPARQAVHVSRPPLATSVRAININTLRMA
jgi:hypothetical protein